MIFKQETIKSWFTGVGSSINNEVVQPFQNANSIIITVSLTGCSKYEKDESYDTDLYGSYSKNMDITFIQSRIFIFEKKIKRFSFWYFNFKKLSKNILIFIYGFIWFQYNIKEIIEDNVTKDSSVNGKILSTEEISNDLYMIK